MLKGYAENEKEQFQVVRWRIFIDPFQRNYG